MRWRSRPRARRSSARARSRRARATRRPSLRSSPSGPGWRWSKITVIKGDTDAVARGTGTYGSKSTQIGGVAAGQASEALVELAKQLAADELEANVDDMVLDLDAGRFHVAGAPEPALAWSELASRLQQDGRLGELSAEVDFEPSQPTFPFGAHIAIVEVDTETAAVTLRRMIAVDDAGTIINPIVADGQVHGGVAAGIAQALFEELRYDEEGNPQNANLVTYCVPAAPELPILRAHRDGDADADQSARRQGDRRVGHDRRDAGRAERGHRRAPALRGALHRDAGQRAAGVGGAAAGPGRLVVPGPLVASLGPERLSPPTGPAWLGGPAWSAAGLVGRLDWSCGRAGLAGRGGLRTPTGLAPEPAWSRGAACRCASARSRGWVLSCVPAWPRGSSSHDGPASRTPPACPRVWDALDEQACRDEMRTPVTVRAPGPIRVTRRTGGIASGSGAVSRDPVIVARPAPEWRWSARGWVLR